MNSTTEGENTTKLTGVTKNPVTVIRKDKRKSKVPNKQRHMRHNSDPIVEIIDNHKFQKVTVDKICEGRDPPKKQIILDFDDGKKKPKMSVRLPKFFDPMAQFGGGGPPPEDIEVDLRPENAVCFHYHGRFLYFFRKLQVDYLPASVMDVCYDMCSHTPVGQLSYQSFLSKNKIIKKYRMALMGDKPAMDRFNKALDNFYYSYLDGRSINRVQLSQANSTFFANNRRVNENLTSEKFYHNFSWWKILAALVSVYLIYRKLRSFFSYFTGRNTLIETFPRFSVYLEELIKCLPGGWRLVALLERIKYGGWYTYNFHKSTHRLGLVKRIQTHLNYNANFATSGFFHAIPSKCTATPGVQEYMKVQFQKSADSAPTYIERLYQWIDKQDLYSWMKWWSAKLPAKDRPQYEKKILLKWINTPGWQHLPWKRDPTQHTIIQSFPTFSIVMEELIKCLPFGWWFVALCERVLNGSWSTYRWHKKSRKWPFFQRLVEHFRVNSVVEEVDPTKLEYHKACETGEWDFIKYNQISPIKDPHMPARTLPHIEPQHQSFWDTTNLSRQGKVLSNHTPVPTEGFYAMMWLVSPMCRPSNTIENQLATILFRVIMIPNSTIDTHHVIWEKFITCFKEVHLDHKVIDNWWQSLRPEQKKNMMLVEKDLANGILTKHIPFGIKGDELINSSDKFIPRLLSLQSGQEFYFMGEQTSALSHWVSNHLFGKIPSHFFLENGYKFTFYFTCGAVSSDIDDYFDAVKQIPGYHTVVMGDDSLTMVVGETIYWIENDFSKFDRTQCNQLRKVNDDWLERHGYTDLIEFRKQEYAKEWAFRVKSDTWKFPKRPKDLNGDEVEMRYTGEADTCFGNSMITIRAFIAVVSSGFGNTAARMTKGYAKLGLKVKCNFMEKYPTYLKGVMIHDVLGKLRWVRLPSFILKFGKILTNPKNIEVGEKNLTLQKRLTILLRGQWLGYGQMCVTRFYTDMNKEILRICSETSKVNYIYGLEAHQVKMTGAFTISEEAFDSFLWDRYKMHPLVFENYLHALRKITTLPVLITNPISQYLLVDY